MNILGFDFGTTNSLVCQIRAGVAVPGLDLFNRPAPSAVAYGNSGMLYGLEARAVDQDYYCVRSPKRCLASGGIFYAGREYQPAEIIAASIGHILRQTAQSPRELELAKIDGAVATIPVTLAGWQRAILREAFSAAGVPITQFLYEPFAALYAFFRSRPAEINRFAGKPLLVVDWGGGTLDITLCRLEGARLVQLAIAGMDDVGGDAVDEIIMNHALDAALAEKGLSSYKSRPGAMASLLAECESAKISLSSRDQAIIYVDSFFEGLADNSLQYVLTRQTLDEITAPVLARAEALIRNLLVNAGYAPEQVAFCLFIGGMANMPAIASGMTKLFGSGRAVCPPDQATLVAEGAAWFASDAAELLLAKNIEVELARGNYFPLLKAGASLPCCGQDGERRFVKLYCVDPRDGQAKIMICQPAGTGRPFPSDPRQSLELMTVQVDDKARPYFEDISLKYYIDKDLILRLGAVSSHLGAHDEAEIHTLEFAVELPQQGRAPDLQTPDTESGAEKAGPAGLTLRSNIVDSERKGDDYYIPGDLLYQLRPDLFDKRNEDLPLIQRDERNYGYLRCSLCGRRLHDPHCMCRI